MLQRLYVNNFRCLENFELNLKDLPSALLIGKNGTGKSTIAAALMLLQRVGRGINKVGDLIQPKDFAQGRSNVPIRFELEVLLNNKLFKYVLALELPPKFRELRIHEEQLTIADQPVYSRQGAIVSLADSKKTSFPVDGHMVALHIIQDQTQDGPAQQFKTWLAQMMILAPIPSLMSAESSGKETLEPERDCSNFSDWFSSVLRQYPAAYSTMADLLKQIMPDFHSIKNTSFGKEAKSIVVKFSGNGGSIELSFDDLSDGEKCFFLCAIVLAANEYYGPLFCFWDEPDNYLALSEVGHFIMDLRRATSRHGQMLMTSHNSEAIRKFSEENILVLDRKNHLEPTLLRPLAELGVAGDLVSALILGDVEV